MKEAVWGVGMFSNPDVAEMPEREQPSSEARSTEANRTWNPSDFAREQIRGLVSRLFLTETARPVRQVVFSAIEAETDVRRICRRIGEALSPETAGSVAVVGGNLRLLQTLERSQRSAEEARKLDSIPPLRRIATQVGSNLWMVPAAARNPSTFASLHSYLGELRREFDYSIIEGPPAGESNEATAMAQFADGMVLVLSAQRSRRVTAVKINEMLQAARANLLGTVLCDREFPIPDRLYRRL